MNPGSRYLLEIADAYGHYTAVGESLGKMAGQCVVCDTVAHGETFKESMRPGRIFHVCPMCARSNVIIRPLEALKPVGGM